MLKTSAAILLTAILAGCAGSESHTRGLELQNILRVDPSPGPGYDLTVEIKNLIDVGFDPDNPETRKTTALVAVRAECPTAQIAREDTFRKGEYLFGRPALTYYVRIRCRPA